MNRFSKRLGAIGAALVLGLCGCAKNGAGRLPAQTASPKSQTTDPVTIRMYGNLDAPFLPFLERIQERFPGIKLEYEFQWDEACFGEPERRALHEDGSDLWILRGDALESMSEKGYLLDLTGEEFSARYHVSTMTSLDENGRIYGLPLPGDIRCLLCNRGILKEQGILKLPETVFELTEICRTLTDRGQGAIIVDGELYGMLLCTGWLYGPQGYDWLRDYNDGQGVMLDTPAQDAWTRLWNLAQVSGCDWEDAEALPARRTNLMIEGKYAFRVTNLSNLKYILGDHPGMDLVALPYLGETPEDRWVYDAQERGLRFFAADARLARPENGEKKAAVLKLLDWISTEEAQTLLAECAGSSASYVDGMEFQQGELMKYMEPVIRQGRLTSSEKLGRGVSEKIAECAAALLKGEMTPREAAAACDAQNRAYTAPAQLPFANEVIGRAAQTVYWRKPEAVTIGAPMSQLAAQAMAEAYPEADFAFAMAKNAATTLYAGDITLKEALECANGEQDSPLVLVRATGEKLKQVLEMGVGKPAERDFIQPYGIAGAGRLIHPVGLCYTADIRREPGDKITAITLADGQPLDMGKTYTVITSRLMADVVTEPNFSDCPVTDTGKYLRDVLVTYIRGHDGLTPPEPAFTIEGAPVPLYRTGPA